MLHKGFTERPDNEEGIKTAERENIEQSSLVYVWR